MSNFNWQVNFLFKFCIMSWHKSCVNFKLIHFLLWIKGFHQSPSLEIFQCSGENLPNSSSHFPNDKSVFRQILHDSSVSWKITPLYFLRLKVIYFSRKGPIKVHIFETFEYSDQNPPNSCHFWINKSLFPQILHYSSVSWDITPVYIFSWNFIYFQQKEPIKVQIWWKLTWAVKSLKSCTLLDSFCPNYIKFQLFQSDAKFEGKVTLGSKNNMKSLLNFNASSSKSGNLHFDVLLLSVGYKVSAKKVQKNDLSAHWRVIQTLKKNWLFVWNNDKKFGEF